MDHQNTGLSAGARVTYRVRGRSGDGPRPCCHGTVAGEPIFDRYTMEVWVPVQPDGASDDVEPRLIRKESIIEVTA
ncbi:hypothetical protein [Amycolatopsis pithecellobii]|uniref:Uncharacterized protein n=1 Tax=Amycolatopsis pithecellobii TaxID=664692 RepID=A0A6N7YV12_9PSEU|nr:hypothetical protein [Amycolatopsis pithecellobii]MTD55782.1 hypothetical protein [Amycolatopsis pithecellobii]